MGSGAVSCLHMIHGTPVFWATAIFAAHAVYALPGAPISHSTGPYSFSICQFPHHSWLQQILSAYQYVCVCTWDMIIGPPWGSNKFCDFIKLTIFWTKPCIAAFTTITNKNNKTIS